MRRLQLVPYDINLDFVGKRFYTFALAFTIVCATVFGLLTKGLNYGIDFQGGYIFEVRMPEAVDVSSLRERLENLNLGEVALQQFGGEQDLLVRVERKEGDDAYQQMVIEKVKGTLGEGVDYRRVETVGPKVGAELVKNSIKAVTFALLAMLIYIAVRFEWQFALCAILALAHDCFAIFGLFTFFHFEFNETAIIAILITAGYSINDTIVIFDRIRENLGRYKKLPLTEVINKSINETLSRTTMTATTTLLALLALYFFGGKVISAFSFPIIIGILVGSFSSICFAAPLLLYMGTLKTKMVSKEKPVAANS
jgi:preprotein translocase subunit SecF